MSAFRWLLVVARRDHTQKTIDFLKNHGAGTIFGMLCHGAAKRNTLDMLGLEAKEKVLLSTLVSRRNASVLMRRLVTEMRIDAPNNGIALTVEVDGISGTSALHYLCGDSLIQGGAMEEMKEYPYSLVVVTADKGQSALVLEAARSVGITGGTLIHTKEIDANPSAKFFGVSIAEEKEQIYIVAPATQRDHLLRAVMEKAGIRSPAHAVAFSLPVDSAVGLTASLDSEDGSDFPSDQRMDENGSAQ